MTIRRKCSCLLNVNASVIHLVYYCQFLCGMTAGEVYESSTDQLELYTESIFLRKVCAMDCHPWVRCVLSVVKHPLAWSIEFL